MMRNISAAVVGALLASLGCTPSGDLDAHARGGGLGGSSPSGGVEPGVDLPAVSDEGQTPGTAGAAVTGAGAASEGGGVPAALDDGVAGSAADAGEGAGEVASAASSGDAGPAELPPPGPGDPGEPSPVVLAELPDDLIDAPVTGEIVFSDEAEWEVDGVFEPTFEIHTPTASYWVVKPLGTIVSLEDREATAAQWISFSSGFRPLRGVPSFPTPPATRVTTVRDDDTQTPTHVRLTSVSDDELWQWVWDFYVTHVTLTVNRAPVPLGFAYQGVPGGSLGAEDRLVSSEGVAQGARSSFNADLVGPVEWAYLADTELGRSVFAIQHRDDTLPERYQVRDNDTSLLIFGDGQIQALPQRFSLGLIPSTDHGAVSERVTFVADAVR